MPWATVSIPVFTVILGVWLLLYLIGKYQFNRVRQHTIDLVLGEVRPALQAQKGLTVEAYYQQILPKWEQIVRKDAIFVPHKYELWPMPATPAYMLKRMNFSPAWVGAYLALNGFHLKSSPELKESIDEILAMVPRRGPQNRSS